MSEATISIRKAILVVVVSCILSSVSTWGVINATPSLALTQVSENHAKTLRFAEPNEQNVTGVRDISRKGLNVTDFIWTPDNPENNAILTIYSYFEYSCESPEPSVWEGEDPKFWWGLDVSIRVNDFTLGISHIERSATSESEWVQRGYTEWDQAAFLAQPNKEGLWINPNQDNYRLTFLVIRSLPETHPAYVRNINVIMEVIDGLPAET